MKNLKELKKEYQDMNKIEQIRAAFENGLSDVQIKNLFIPKMHILCMEEIREAFNHGLPDEQLDILLTPGFGGFRLFQA